MKTKLFILLIFASFTIKAQDLFYYYNGNKIHLEKDRNYLNIIPNNKVTGISDVLSNFSNLIQDQSVQKGKLVKLKFKSTPNDLEYSEIIKTLKLDGHIKNAFPFIKRGNGIPPIGTSDVFYLKLKERKDTNLLQLVANEQNVQVIKHINNMPEWYILSIENSDFSSSIEATNYFFETGHFADVDPAFMFNFKPNCVNDNDFIHQWGFSDIKACPAWGINKGAGIKIAVIDQGIDKTHNDLSANISAISYDAESGASPSVFIPGNSHGTFIAGVLAAEHNWIQVAGVAPESEIIDVSHELDIYNNPTISAELADGINWAWNNANADIISISWGDNGGQFYNDLYSSVLNNAIVNAMTQGRNGKGCIVVIAAGNQGVVEYPADIDDRILTVGAMDSDGNRALFGFGESAYGDKLDVIAPGKYIISTLPGNTVGYGYGTSFSGPMVAGIAALILSKNPNLTRTQVTAIIESTAQKETGTQNYVYSIEPGRPHGTWDNEMGYGVPNAYDAILEADCPTTFVNGTISSDITYTDCKIVAINATIQNNADVIFDANESTTINGSFAVNIGSTLEVK